MYGVYAWNAGATAGQIVGDVLALVCGAAVADLSVACNKAASSSAGAASGWAVVDSAYGVLARAGQAGGPGMTARLTVSGSPRLQLAAVDGWNMATHTAAFASIVNDCSLLTSAAGRVNLLASDAGLVVSAADFSAWVLVGEVKRDGPAFAGDAAAPGCFSSAQGGNTAYMPRLKNPAAAGDTTNAYATVQSVFGSLSAGSARNRGDSIYIPMVTGSVSYSSVPVGEIVGVMVAGGYGLSGDFVTDDAAARYQLFKNPYFIFAVPQK